MSINFSTSLPLGKPHINEILQEYNQILSNINLLTGINLENDTIKITEDGIAIVLKMQLTQLKLIEDIYTRQELYFSK